MRTILIVFSLTILLAVSVAGAAGAALVVFSPLYPGQALFIVQDAAEQALVSMTRDPAQRAALALDLLQRRTANLQAERGGQVELESLRILNRELDQAIALLVDVPSIAAPGLRTRFTFELGKIRQVMTDLNAVPDQFAPGFAAFKDKLDLLLAVASDPSQPLSALLQPQSKTNVALALGGSEPAAGSKSSQPELSIDPRTVLFPAGSKGAKHDFFPLTGKHAGLECTACHANGQFAGTPNQCVDCHSQVIPPDHYQADCKLCHNTSDWKSAVFNHQAVNTTNCIDCHTKNKPANHFNGQCSLCHSTTAWKPADFNHQGAAAANCTSCHTRDKPANHFPGQCSACHSTRAWMPASFNHAVAGATVCTTCHMQDKPANHFAGQCGLCHATAAWKPASFNHKGSAAADCVSCHTKDKPANHFSGQCGACHKTTTWSGAVFNHKAANATNCISCHTKNKPANHFSGQCGACHSTSAWSGAVFNHKAANATDCISCHTKNKPANHFDGQCSQCHTTTAWSGAVFNHKAANATDCVSCHTKDKPANHFDGQCSTCHNTGSWQGASFNHTFPQNHGGANAVCATCHPSGTATWTCSTCHAKAQLDENHKNIPNYATRCMDCHANGKKPGD